MANATCTSRPTTFGLLWHSPNSSNYGIGALTVAHIALLEEVARSAGLDPDFEITGWSDPLPDYFSAPNVRFHPFSGRFLLKPNGLAAMARRSRIVLDIGAGDSFTDIYGAKRFGYQVLSKLIVLATGTPLILAPQTIGPFESRATQSIARWVMRASAAVVARDKLSSQFVRKLDPAIRLMEATDVAFALPASAVERPVGDKIHVGINVSGLLFAGGYSRQNDFALSVNYPELMRELIKRFAASIACKVHLFSHVNIPRKYRGVAEDDYFAAEQIASEFGGNVVAAPQYNSPQEIKAHIATMDFFAGSRMHACIAAFSAGVPTVPLAYSRKFRGLFSTLGYDRVADLRSETPQTVLAKVMDGFRNRQALKLEVEACNFEVQRRLQYYQTLVRSQLYPQGEECPPQLIMPV